MITPILSESNRASYDVMNKIKRFIASEISGLSGFQYRFGILSEIALHTPFYLFDNEELCKKYNTAFTDGSSIYFNVNFFNSLREEENSGDSPSLNNVLIILHELLHIVLRHTQRDILISKDINHQDMNWALDSIINGVIYSSFTHYLKQINPSEILYPTLQPGKFFLLNSIGLNKKDYTFFYGDYSAPLIKEPYLKEIFEFLHWENTLGNEMSEIEVYNGIQEIKKKYNVESLPSLNLFIGGVVEPEELLKSLKDSGLSEEEIRQLGVALNDFEQQQNKDMVENLIADTIANSDPHKNLSTKSLLQKLKQRVVLKKKPVLSWKFELQNITNEVGISHKTYLSDHPDPVYLNLEIDSFSDNIDYVIYEEEEFPSSNEDNIIFIIDTSGSVSNSELETFSSEVISFIESMTKDGDGVNVWLIPADDSIDKDSIIHITPENIDSFHDVLLSGRGGTSFEKALIGAGEFIKEQKINAFKNGLSFDVHSLIYITDGYDTAPSSKPHQDLPEKLIFIVSDSKNLSSLEEKASSYASVCPLTNGSIIS